MISADLMNMISGRARVQGIDPRLLAALVDVESSGDVYAWKPEPKYIYMWDVRKKAPFRKLTDAEVLSEEPPNDFHSLAGSPAQEWWGQQISWGLCQLMGGVARERGFMGSYLPELSNPLVNLSFGAAHISDLLKWANGDEKKAIAAYNVGRGNWATGTGQAYATKVLARRVNV